MNFIVDVDGTLCEIVNSFDEYYSAKPKVDIINKVNSLYKSGSNIILFTARGMRTFNNDVAKIEEVHRPILENWLKQNGVLYHELRFGKAWSPECYYVDDKSMSLNEFLNV